MDENSCIDVIRSVHNELGYNDLNELLIDMVMKCYEAIATDSLIKIKNTVQEKLDNVDTTNNNDNKEKRNVKSQQNDNKKWKSLRLPIDLIIAVFELKCEPRSLNKS